MPKNEFCSKCLDIFSEISAYNVIESIKKNEANPINFIESSSIHDLMALAVYCSVNLLITEIMANNELIKEKDSWHILSPDRKLKLCEDPQFKPKEEKGEAYIS